MKFTLQILFVKIATFVCLCLYKFSKLLGIGSDSVRIFTDRLFLSLKNLVEKWGFYEKHL